MASVEQKWAVGGKPPIRPQAGMNAGDGGISALVEVVLSGRTRSHLRVHVHQTLKTGSAAIPMSLEALHLSPKQSVNCSVVEYIIVMLSAEFFERILVSRPGN